MSNYIHFKVLLKKNFITLRRKYGFLLAFILLPIISMGIFALVELAISDGNVDESYNFNYMFFSSTRYVMPLQYEDVKFSDTDMGYSNYTSLYRCLAYEFNNFALVGSNDTLDLFDNAIANLTFMGLTANKFNSRDDLFEIVRTEQTSTYCFGLQIDKFDTETDEYEFQVMWQHILIPDTNNAAYDLSQRTPDFSSWNKYKTSGYMGVYAIIVNTIIDQKGKSGSFDVAYLPFKTPEYKSINSAATEQLTYNFPSFVMFTFLIPLYYIVSKLAEEKEFKSREGMKMMGLKDFSYFASWIVFFFIIILGMSLILTGMVSINVFSGSNKLLIFFMAMCYGCSLFGFGLVIVAILPNVRSSATAASLLHVVTFFAIYAIDTSNPAAMKISLSIFPNIGMYFCVYNLFHFETNSDGLTWENASQKYGNISYNQALSMLAFDTFFYLLLGLYLDQILSSQFGIPKKWYFLCTRKFWCSKKERKVKDITRETDGEERDQALLGSVQGDETDYEKRHPADFEPVPEILKRQAYTNECLKLENLRKVFGQKIAVDNTNITMYNGQIFALLGHNGAGKTTTISMLTGLLQASKGKASVFGLDIFNEMDDFRKILGVCPQHDVLFEFLTPREHLELFAAFKGTPQQEIPTLVDNMIKDIDLVSVQNQQAKTLSGGQKRKLSVAIAMIGNSKIVILDEPSSGMDTSSRRRLWEMLKQNKNGRIVILTTHYMDEADILGDRICIMADGKIKCCGSSLFLKNRYGVGYNLVIAKKTRHPAPQIDDFIFNRISKAKKLQEVSSEMTFQLPTEASSQFKDFFTELDQNLDNLGIRSYGVGITTLEEVFLKIAKGEHTDDGDAEEEDLRKFTLDKFSNSDKKGSGNAQGDVESLNKEEYSIAEQHEKEGFGLFLQHLKVLLYKKFKLQVRDPRTCIIEILFPIFFIFAGLELSQVRVFSDGEARLLSPSIFPTPSPVYYNTPVHLGGDSSTFVSNYFTDSFWDTNVEEVTITDSSDYIEMITQYDDYLLDASNTKLITFFGDYFYYNLNGNSDGKYAAFVIANATSQDAVAAYGAYIHQALLQDIIGNKALQLKITSQPFPLTILEQGVVSAATGATITMLFAVAYMMVSDSLVKNIIAERMKNVKHQMIISGVSLPAYWLSHYILDILFQAPPSICAIIGIQAFGLDFPDAWVIILVFIFANPVFVYAFSWLFDNDNSASITIRLGYVLIGSILPIAVQILLVIESTVKIGKIIRWFFYILPIYSLNMGMSNIADRKIMAAVEGRDAYEPLSFEVAGPSVLFLVLDIFLYWFIMFLVESKIFQKCCRRQQQPNLQSSIIDQHLIDEDIIEEERRVEQADPRGLSVKLHKLIKFYGKTQAVDNVSFGLEYGECFALLGVSGAGKTTTFKCLTGEEKPTTGQVCIQGFDVTTTEGFNNARKLIGYCPQFDAIFDRLTVKEHLMIYATLKGVLLQYREQLIESQLDEMDLREFQNVQASNLSGGNKRKLSVAMALIGNPPIIFLDEPSTGVDPKAKRFMWTIVSKISTQRKKSSVIITTHSMEEAEALCTKMGIMVAGKFKCFGSSQHIKAKYGTGYEIEIKIKYLKEEDLADIKQDLNIQEYDQRISKNEAETILQKFDAMHLMNEISEKGSGSDFHDDFNGSQKSVDIDEFIRWVFTESRGGIMIEKLESMFTSVEVLEHYNNSYVFKVSRDNYSIGYLFGMMEDIKAEYSISEYSVSQTTLEQIFNNFAKEAEKEKVIFFQFYNYIQNPRKRTTVVRKSAKGEKQELRQSNGYKLKSERMKTEALDKSE